MEQRRLHSLSLACEYSRLSLLLVAREVPPGGTWRNVPSSQVRGETTVFAGYAIASLGTLSKEGDDGSENVGKK